LEEIMKSTMEDVCVGPFGSTAEVTKFLGSSSWIPTQRFAVSQAHKVRGCDSATVNFVNVATVIQEKLQLPSTDQNVAVIRRLWAEAEGRPIEGWVLDEKKAYRYLVSALGLDERQVEEVEWAADKELESTKGIKGIFGFLFDGLSRWPSQDVLGSSPMLWL
jgi:hypothetical protein